jgi:UDP-N-acetylglucosamine 2-epimerase (non-hydrolysing)
MKITIVAGARPNFMKIAPIISAIKAEQRNSVDINYRLVHTGQHYDKALSESFFEDLSIPHPDRNLEVGSGSQSVQTANIMVRFEKELEENPTDAVLVVGDINSTMACSIVAKKMCIPLLHVEAGIRSFDLSMPEEINRLVTDAIADHFFTTTLIANQNLLKAGIENERIHFVGNTMIDSLYSHREKFVKPLIFDKINLIEKDYFVLTLHRPSNVDDISNLKKTLDIIIDSTKGKPILFPAHPRTTAKLKGLNLDLKNIIIIEPLRYLEFMFLIERARAVITDSGGVQEETTVLGVPCITLRRNSERPETIIEGTNQLVPNIEELQIWINRIFNNEWKKGSIPELWDGKTSVRIIEILKKLYDMK